MQLDQHGPLARFSAYSRAKCSARGVHGALLASMLLAALAIATAPARAQSEQGSEPAARDSICEPIAWSLEVEDPTTLRQELASLEVRRRALGAGAFANEGFARRLLELRKLAASETPFEGQAELLRDACLLHARAALDAGDRDAARVILSEPCPRASEADPVSGAAPRSASPAFASMVTGVVRDPLLVRLRQQLESPGQEGKADESELLERAVERAIEEQDWATIRAIGPRAAPYLVDVALRSDTIPAEAAWDPLSTLIELDSGLAARSMLTLTTRDSYLLRRRVLRVMQSKQVLYWGNEKTWSIQRAPGEEYGSCRSAEPQWQDLLAWVLEEPDLLSTALPLVWAPLFYDALTPALATRLERIMREVPLEQRPALLTDMQDGRTLGTSQGVFEALLVFGSARERETAAFLLSQLPRSTALLALVDDPDPKMRALVARSRQEGRTQQVMVWSHLSGRDLQPRPVPVVVEASDRARLAQLLDDEDLEVRQAALKALLDHDWLEEDELKRLLARSTANDDLMLLNAHQRLTSETRAIVIDTVLARYLTPENFNYALLDSLGRVFEDIAAHDAAFLEPFLPRYVESRAFEYRGEPVMTNLLRSAEGATALISALASISKPALRTARATSFFIVLYNSRSDERWQANLTRVASERPLELARVLGAFLPEGNVVPARTLSAIQADLLPVFALVARSADSTPSSRLAALRHQEFRDPVSALAVVSALEPREEPASSMRTDLRSAVAALDPNARAEFLDGVLEQAGANPVFVVSVANGNLMPGDPGSAERVVRVLNWLLAHSAIWTHNSQDPMNALVWQAITLLAQFPEAASPELVAQLFAEKRAAVSKCLYEVLARVRDPRHLPALEAELETERMVVSGEAFTGGAKAAETITSYLSEEAGEVLARGLSSSLPTVRAACSRGLQEIERVLAQRRAWANREQQLPTREETLAELLQLMEDVDLDLRVEAIHALATLGAVEALPKLVRLVKDPEPRIARAAREALQRMRALKPRPAEDSERAGSSAPGGGERH